MVFSWCIQRAVVQDEYDFNPATARQGLPRRFEVAHGLPARDAGIQLSINLNLHTSTVLRKNAAFVRERMKAPVNLQNQKSLPLWKLHVFICEK